MKRQLITLLFILVLMGCSATNYSVLVETSPPTKNVKISANEDLVGKTDENGELYFEKDVIDGTPKFTIIAKYKDFYGMKAFDISPHTDYVYVSENVIKSKETSKTEHGHDFYVNFGNLPETAASIIIHTNVPFVDVYLNDEKIGNTSTNKQLSYELFEGNHSIKVSKKDYKTQNKSFTLKAGENKNLYFEINEKPKQYGYLKLTSNEQYVDVYIDGKFAGQIPGGEKPFNKKIRTGEHSIMVKKQFFSPKSIKLEIEKNEIIPYKFELVKATGGSELGATQSNIYQTKGNLTILTERNDLDVYIDGVKKIPPLQLTEIPAGFYTIRVKGGNIDDSFQVIVNDKETTIIDLDEEYPK